ncbi:MAG TPA: hypothetical protein EYH42_05710 [Sulfurovum sp.]|nr:hypothetical protein [Sulfurovum sp.]
MQNILILASGSIAKHFIDWIGKKRVAENQYYVTCYKAGTTPEKLGKNITRIDADPTSFSKLSHIMSTTNFSDVFVVLEDKEDAIYTLKNIALINPKMRTLLLNQWDDESIGKEYDNLTIIYSQELMAAHLYDHLPNVPLIAQNVGLGRGEIMEIHVPFGSSYAYRHVGSILQRKWKIVAIYRDEKQILPTAATMIRPNDTLLVVGKPLVLDGVYKTINKRIGLFPEPFGKDLYLILDFRFDIDNAEIYLQESIYLLNKLENKSLYVRILYPNNFKLIEDLKTYESDIVDISVSYENKPVKTIIEYDINEKDIGIVMNSIKTFEAENLKETLYSLKKLVYLFGDRHLYNIKKCVILMSENEKMESISATAFDISESLGLNLMLCDFDPDGEFESKKMIIEHYETLTHIFNMKINIEQKVANPIRELTNMKKILQIAPFERDLNTDNFMKLISTKIQDFILTTTRHPKLLVPYALSETKDESRNYPERRHSDF